MLTVHHLEDSRSQRILWLLEELGADYDIRRYSRDPVTSLAPPELLAVHSLGKAPVVTDGDRTVAESAAIIEYLLERYGDDRLVPAAGTPEFDRYRYWMHFAEGSLMPLMVMSLIFSRVEQGAPLLVRPVAKGIAGKVRGNYLEPNIRRALEFVEETLASSDWFAGGDLTAADIQMSFPLEAASVRVGLGERYPALRRWLDTIHARPAYRAALDKGGPYSLLG